MARNAFEASRIAAATLERRGHEPAPEAAGVTEESSSISRDDARDGAETAYPNESHSESARDRRVLSANTLTGDHVRNAAGEDLGKVEAIMLDIAAGRVAYAVVSFGGFLGIGDKLFAVPWSALRLDRGEHEFILDVDRKTLDDAPGFDRNHWPDMANPSFGEEVHNHYAAAKF